MRPDAKAHLYLGNRKFQISNGLIKLRRLREIVTKATAAPRGTKPSSLANVFRSLGEDATSEKSVLAGTGLCWTGFCIMGLTLDELAGLARAKTARRVTVLRDMSEEGFRNHLKSSNDPAHRYIINFDRKMIFGRACSHMPPAPLAC